MELGWTGLDLGTHVVTLTNEGEVSGKGGEEGEEGLRARESNKKVRNRNVEHGQMAPAVVTVRSSVPLYGSKV